MAFFPARKANSAPPKLDPRGHFEEGKERGQINGMEGAEENTATPEILPRALADNAWLFQTRSSCRRKVIKILWEVCVCCKIIQKVNVLAPVSTLHNHIIVVFAPPCMHCRQTLRASDNNHHNGRDVDDVNMTSVNDVTETLAPTLVCLDDVFDRLQ